jgi:RimJ/RimL family protein N-acetyltransferase
MDIRGVGVTDIGYAMHPWARGRGLVTRAIRLATRWAFDHGGAEIIHWRAHVGNVASRRTAWKTGFTFHGTVPKLLYERGRAIDTWIASLQPDADGTPTTRWLEPPVMRGERVVLRPYRDDDATRIVESGTDPLTEYWLANLPRPSTEAAARSWVLERVEAQSLGRGVWWCVADPDSDLMLANVAVFGLDSKYDSNGEIGYWAHPDARGRGVVTEAARLVTAHALAPESEGGLGVRRLQLAAGTDNAASRHIAMACGFTEVGRHRAVDQLGDGSYTDFVWYDRLASD